MKNEKEIKIHQDSRTIEKEENNLVGGSGSIYSDIKWEDMPSGTYTSGYIPFGGTTWAVMSDYDSIASNHCSKQLLFVGDPTVWSMTEYYIP